MVIVVILLAQASVGPVHFLVTKELVTVIMLAMIRQMNVMVPVPVAEPVMVLAAVSIRVLQLPAVAYKIAIT